MFDLKYQMKLFEKLFKFFLIFIQFIQIDAIVGGYESERHGNALIKRLINYLEFLLVVPYEIQHSVKSRPLLVLLVTSFVGYILLVTY